jgi:hypothetical protein
LLRDYRIPLHNSGGRRQYFVDRDWLYDEHVTKGRSLIELARELGISRTTVAQWAQTHDTLYVG